MKMEVHRQVHRDSRGRRMVTVEEIHVCMRAWMHIFGVLKSTFYRYQTYMNNGREALDHGNKGLPLLERSVQSNRKSIIFSQFLLFWTPLDML